MSVHRAEILTHKMRPEFEFTGKEVKTQWWARGTRGVAHSLSLRCCSPAKQQPLSGSETLIITALCTSGKGH